MIYIVDHVDLDAWSVPEVLRPLYESPKILAQKMTIAVCALFYSVVEEHLVTSW
jgi:homeobox-leucine zipper protein